jgi:hypothetical protein
MTEPIFLGNLKNSFEGSLSSFPPAFGIFSYPLKKSGDSLFTTNVSVREPGGTYKNAGQGWFTRSRLL